MDYLNCRNAFLAHHGIKGMRWGQRRYQNDDGTLTELGRERYRVRLMDKRAKQVERLDKKKLGSKKTSYTDRAAKTLVYNDPAVQKARRDKDQLWEAWSEYASSENPFPKHKALMDELGEKARYADWKYNNELGKAITRHKEELLSARLKDIHEKDTGEGRRLMEKILNDEVKYQGIPKEYYELMGWKPSKVDNGYWRAKS